MPESQPQSLPEKTPYSGDEKREGKDHRRHLSPQEAAVEIAGSKYHWARPSDTEFADAQFTGGEPVKKAVAALFDKLEGKEPEVDPRCLSYKANKEDRKASRLQNVYFGTYDGRAYINFDVPESDFLFLEEQQRLAKDKKA